MVSNQHKKQVTSLAKIEEMKTRIQQIMNREGMTQQTFANELNMSPASLSSIFTGRTNPTQNHVCAIHRRFPNISISWLMFGEGDMYENREDKDENGGVSAASIEGGASQNQPKAVGNAAEGVHLKPIADDARRVEIQYVDRPRRLITEIRIFFDDSTYETFSRKEKV